MLSSTTCIRFVPTAKNLGIIVDNSLSFHQQVLKMKKTSFLTICNIRKIRNLLSNAQLRTVTNSLVVSCLDYCNSLYFGIHKRDIRHLQVIQNAASKCITGKFKHDHIDNDLNDLHWLPIQKRILFKIALLVFKALMGEAPEYLQSLLSYKSGDGRRTCDLYVPKANTRFGMRAFATVGPKIWNLLPEDLRQCTETTAFKQKLKTYFFTLSGDVIDKLGLANI